MAKYVWLLIKTVVLRFLMRVSMFLHGYPFPRPPKPAFTQTLPSQPQVKLLFYTPPGYLYASEDQYPVVVNFHGGGFCLGCASDDGRWARTLVNTTGAVVVSVEYRLAPEWPFPAAVDDGVAALRYLESHADELRLDISRVALTGFSAGGNLAFTVPLRFYASLQQINSNTSSNSSDSDDGSAKPDASHLTPTPTSSTRLRIRSITSWYPILDFELPRHIRRTRSPQPSKTLSPFLTSLFDNSYLPHIPDRGSPFASPLRADSALLASALPRDIFMYICEWDMLEREGREFVNRLETCQQQQQEEQAGSSVVDNNHLQVGGGGGGRGESPCTRGKKKVRSMVIQQSQHAWDKSANPFRDQGRIDVLYRAASEEVKNVFDRAVGVYHDQDHGPSLDM